MMNLGVSDPSFLKGSIALRPWSTDIGTPLRPKFMQKKLHGWLSKLWSLSGSLI